MKQWNFLLGFILCNSLCVTHVTSVECEESSFSQNSHEILSEYVIDLDVPPAQRWEEVIKNKSRVLTQLFEDIKELVISIVGHRLYQLLDNQLPKIAKSLPSPYDEEIKGMALVSGLPLSHFTLYNVFYEMFVLCTSIVVQDQDGNIYHGRNLDNGAFLGWDTRNHTWKVSELLKPLTVVIHWKRDGKTLYKSASFAGYAGILTAVKKNNFSFSLNKRLAVNNGIVGLLEWLFFKDHKQRWVSFLSREVLEEAEDFEAAKAALSQQRLLAPVYYILAGVKAGQAVIITRDRDNVNLLRMDSPASPYDSWFLVETNYDHWKSPRFYDDRRTPSVRCLREGGQRNASFALLFSVLSTKPILNKSTVYTTLMQAKTGTIRTWLRTCPDPCFPW